MKDLIHQHVRLPATTPEAADKIRLLGEETKHLTQIEFVTEHLLHAGMYTRTVRLPPNTVCTAVLITPPTVLITAGDVDIWVNDILISVRGYNVLPGNAGRKVAFVTRTEVGMSMIFPCKARTVEEAQKEFTSEYELLPPLSKEYRHRVLITGE